MIARIEGTLESLAGEAALVRTEAGLSYEVLLPAFAAHRLAASTGQAVTLHTLEFLESQGQGATFLPRLAGFLTTDDKAFYELFVTAKGIGYRRALRAMTLSSSQIAAAIADRDLATLQSLPEIGKRTAENLAVNLRDKVEPFTATTASPAAEAGDGDISSSGPGRSQDGHAVGPETRLAQEAVEAMVQLGEQRADALRWVDQVLQTETPPSTTEAVLAEVYRRKASGGG